MSHRQLAVDAGSRGLKIVPNRCTALRFIPKEDLRYEWPWIRKGLERILESSSQHWLPEDVYMALKTESAEAFRGVLEGETAGFVILQKHQSLDGTELFIWAAHTMEDGRDFYEDIEQIAKDVGAKRVVFWSNRMGWRRLAKRYGFTPSNVRYTKEL